MNYNLETTYNTESRSVRVKITANPWGQYTIDLARLIAQDRVVVALSFHGAIEGIVEEDDHHVCYCFSSRQPDRIVRRRSDYAGIAYYPIEFVPYWGS